MNSEEKNIILVLTVFLLVFIFLVIRFAWTVYKLTRDTPNGPNTKPKTVYKNGILQHENPAEAYKWAVKQMPTNTVRPTIEKLLRENAALKAKLEKELNE